MSKKDHFLENEFVKPFRWLHDNKKFAAWGAYALLTLSILLDNWFPQIFPVAVFVYLSIMTNVLLDIHRRSEPERTVFPSHQEAQTEFHDEIRSALRQPGRCDIAWIGVTMQSAWLTLENALGKAIQSKQVSNLHIRLLQTDPNFLESILPQGDSQPNLVRKQAEHIETFCSRYTTCLSSTESSLAIAQYAYMPNYHGILINDSVLYLSNVRWSDSDLSELSVPHEPFERFDRSTERGVYMIGLYKSWLEKGFRIATSSKSFPPMDEIKGVRRLP